MSGGGLTVTNGFIGLLKNQSCKGHYECILHSMKKENPMLIESVDDALEWGRKHLAQLKRGEKDDCLVAWRKLIECRPDRPCGLEACRVCMREFRLSWLGQAVPIMVQRPD
ncbi:MAG: hypothetical protein ACJ8F3_00190 [Xanthobacteraceae bacterium]